jgi:glycine dehydrogenase subunit 2
MLTNPNTCGLFEDEILEIAEGIHGAGGYFYCDGANFNALVGRVRPGDLGIDAMHINLHKTFSTPHGGGGPGAGPVVLSAALTPFAPLPHLIHDEGGFRLLEYVDGETGEPFGRMSAFHGQMGMFVRALAFMLSHGADGLRRVAEDAVLNANYIQAQLKDVMTPAFDAHRIRIEDEPRYLHPLDAGPRARGEIRRQGALPGCPAPCAPPPSRRDARGAQTCATLRGRGQSGRGVTRS